MSHHQDTKFTKNRKSFLLGVLGVLVVRFHHVFTCHVSLVEEHQPCLDHI
jgi:hypothetical protein